MDSPQLLVSKFLFMMAVTSVGVTIIALDSEMDDYGVYAKRTYRNSFGTRLIARGTKAAVESLVAEVSA